MRQSIYAGVEKEILFGGQFSMISGIGQKERRSLNENLKVSFRTFVFFGEAWLFFGMALYYVVFYTVGKNPLLARVGGDFSGHALVWIAILLFGFYVRIRLPKNKNWIRNAFQSFLIPVFAISVVESIFQLAYWSMTWQHIAPTTLPDMEIAIGFIFSFIGKSYKFFMNKRFLIALLLMSLYVLVWRTIGLPISIDISEVTGYRSIFYSDPLTNFLEIFQWVSGMLLLAWAFLFKKGSAREFQFRVA